MFVNVTFLQFILLGKNGFPKPRKSLVNSNVADHTLHADILFAAKVCQINCREIKKKALKTPRFQCFLGLLMLRLNQ